MNNNENEVWKDVVHYEGYYQISDLGQLRSVDAWVDSNGGGKRLRKGQIIITWLWNGYERAHLSKNNQRKTVSIHRLVATAFIANPDRKTTLNHRNGIKSDNRVQNLEWCTQHENILHALETGLRDAGKTAKQVIDTCNNKIYRSIAEASAALGISYHQCRRRIKAGGCLRLAA
jgi:hypothetical protein